MSNEFRAIGPPGTGKTTWLSRQVERGAEAYGPHRVMVCSFTRAAVAELNQRQLPIPEEMVGTLHAICYRGLDRPEICETGKHFKEFSEAYPQWSIGEGTRDSLDDGYASSNGSDRGDICLREYSRLRNLMRPRELWTPTLLEFARHWEDYKTQANALDFTDLIEMALKDISHPPGLPDILFMDEAQDLAPLQYALIRKWGEKMDRFIVVGDDLQTIYSFAGADPSHLLAPLPVDNVKVLKQSYRVPRTVHAFAESLANKIPAECRTIKEYFPRDFEGEVRRAPASFKNPEQLLRLAEHYVNQGKTVTFLASCSYMLSPILEVLRASGLPFSNPYRRRRRDWNPLFKNRDQISAADRVQAFLSAFTSWDEPLWTPSNLQTWLEMTKGVVHRGGREKLMELGGEEPVPATVLGEIMPLTEVTAAQKEGLGWLARHLKKQWERSGSYAIKVALREPERLQGEPLLRLGTVHSVKGGESDVVILSPDMSPQAMRQWLSGSTGRHEVLRLFYVGATRARESLILAAPGSRMAMGF